MKPWYVIYCPGCRSGWWHRQDQPWWHLSPCMCGTSRHWLVNPPWLLLPVAVQDTLASATG